MHARIRAASHTGLVRRRNEDSYGATALVAAREDGVVAAADVGDCTCLCVIADGLGGHPFGDVASRLAVGVLLGSRAANPEELLAAFVGANVAVHEAASGAEGAPGMGTTAAALLLSEEGVAIVNIGDSPVFECIDGRLVQLSVDDVPFAGRDLLGLPSAHVTQTLGGTVELRPIEPHVYTDDVLGHRRFLLCTDGLTNFVPRSEIAAELSRTGDASVEALIRRCLDAGAPDNVTVMVIDVSW
jgi:PPM family protein phosphatase